MAKTATKVATASKGASAPAPKPKPATTKSNVPAVSKGKDVATDDVMKNLPAFMQQDVGRGMEGVGAEDMEIPRLKLIQGTSPELQEFNDLRAGNFFHTATQTIFDETMRVTPIYMQKEYILWNPLDAGGGILARASDAVHWSPADAEFKVKIDKKTEVIWKTAKTVQQSGLANWGTFDPSDKDSPPAATLMYNFLFGFPDYPDLPPAVFTFQRSSIKVGRKFITKLKTVRFPIFGTVHELSSAVQGEGTNSYFVPAIVAAGLVDDEDMYNTFKSMHEGFSTKGLNIKDIDGLNGEDGASDDDENEGDKPKY